MVTIPTYEDLQILVSNLGEKLIEDLKSTVEERSDEMLSTKEVARALSISIRSVIEYTKQGKLQSYRLGGSVRYKRSEVLNSWTAINHASLRATSLGKSGALKFTQKRGGLL